MDEFEDWETTRDRRPLIDEHGDARYRLTEAEYQLDEVRRRRRLSQSRLDALADARPDRSFAELADELVGLTRIVEALGGHVDVRAVFEDETITLLREPAPEVEPPDG